MHIMEHALSLMSICIMFFGNEDKVWHEIRVAKQRSYASNDISVEDLTDLVPNKNLVSFEAGPSW